MSNQHIKRVYNSLHEIIHQIETKPYHKLVEDELQRHSFTGNFSFTETHSLKDALVLAKQGWKKGRDIISKLTKEHEDAFVKLFPKQDFEIQLQASEAGEIVNVDAAIQNLPESMFHFHTDEEKMRKLAAGKMQRILISGSLPFYIKADTVFNRGAIVSSMINIMELYGFRTELWICWPIEAYGTFVKYYVRIKRFDGDLDLGLLAFATCHPSMTRRIMFAMLEQETEHDWVIWEYVNKNYGTVIDLNEEEILNFGGGLAGYGNIYFESLFGNQGFTDLLNNTKVKIQQHFTSIKI